MHLRAASEIVLHSQFAGAYGLPGWSIIDTGIRMVNMAAKLDPVHKCVINGLVSFGAFLQSLDVKFEPILNLFEDRQRTTCTIELLDLH